MEDQTQPNRGSALGRLLALALTFAVGYVLGSRSGRESEPWEQEREPTEITIDDAEDGEGADGGSANERGTEE